MNLATHSFTLRQLQYLVAVADELSFHRAAARCHVSQPALSVQLAQLEDSLGVQVFERDRRRVLLTHAGGEIVERARRILVEVADLVEAGERASDPRAGVLRIGVIPTIAPYLLPNVAPKLRAAFPRLALAWREEKTGELVRALEAGELDTVLLALEADIGEVESEIIAIDPFVLAVGPRHPLSCRTSVDASELNGTEVLLLDDGHCFRNQALEVCSTARAREGAFRATSLTTLVQMVASGMGATLLPALSLATETKRARLHLCPIASKRARRTIALVWRPRSPLAPVLHELAGVLRAAFPRPAGVRTARKAS